jgi:hypothetical protein
MENNMIEMLKEDENGFLDGWYKLSSVGRDEQIKYTKKIKLAGQSTRSAAAVERRSRLAAELTKVILNEFLPEQTFESARVNLYPLLRMSITKLLEKHQLDVIPEGARYWLPHEGETVYIIRERDDGSIFIDEVPFNMFDCELGNFLALGRVLFLTHEEAVAAAALWRIDDGK